MEKLLKLASLAADQAEIYYSSSYSDNIEFNDAKLDKADSSLSSGLALRIIKDGKMGLAHTRNLLDPEALVKQALLSAENGVDVKFSFPHTDKLAQQDTFDPDIERLCKQDLISQGKEILSYIKQRVNGQVNLGIGWGAGEYGILNSAGTSLDHRSSEFSMHVQLIFPGTGSGLFEFTTGRAYSALARRDLDTLIELFQRSEQQIVPPTKRMPVIFTSYSLFALLSRFSAASAPANIYNRISPLCGRIGEKIVSEKLSMWQDPFDQDLNDCPAFDTEGTPTQRLDLIEKGVFRGIPLDLNYAEKLQMAPTGNGFRSGIEGLPMAQAFNVCIAPGNRSLEEMISGLKEGIIVQSLMGAHSGNVLNGDYSVGVSAGFMISDGKITGRVKDCLLSGNAYETLSQIAEIENQCKNLGSHKIPSILCEDVSVAGK